MFADKAPYARDGQSLHAPGQLNVTSRRPIGPVGVITPWNTPFMLSTWKIAPALAAGCTVVHKPAELSPITASILLEIAEEAGFRQVYGTSSTALVKRPEGAERTSGDQGHRLCRRKRHRKADHEAGRRH